MKPRYIEDMQPGQLVRIGNDPLNRVSQVVKVVLHHNDGVELVLKPMLDDIPEDTPVYFIPKMVVAG